MKSKITLILTILFLSLFCGSAQNVKSVLGVDNTSGGSEILVDSGINEASGTWGVGGSDGERYIGLTKFQVSTATTITKVVVRLERNFADLSTRDLRVRIWTQTGHALDTQLGVSDAIVANTEIPISGIANVDFEFSTPVSISASTDYAITIDTGFDTSPAAIGHHSDGANNISGHLNNWRGDKSSVWGDTFPSHDLQMDVYGTQP